MKYGLPYMGSKNKLAKRICSLFPYRKNFYDLFCGGCAVTHCALEHNQFERYIINDISPLPVNLFYNAYHGKYKNEKRWISREDFYKFKQSDEYVACCFSFGNNYISYCYSTKIEPYKKACHYAIVFDDWAQFKELCKEIFQDTFDALYGISDIKERRLAFGPAIVKRLKEIGDWDMVQNNPLYKSCHWRGGKFGIAQTNKGGQDLEIQSLESLESLERLERLKTLQHIQNFQNLEYHIGDYRNINISPNSIIYCDIPYKNTTKYNNMPDFDYNSFYNWCEKQTEPVFIRSYSMPKDRFKEIVCFNHRCTLSATANKPIIEKVFIPNHQQQEYSNFLF